MSNEDSVYVTETVFRKPLQCCGLEVLANVDYDRAVDFGQYLGERRMRMTYYVFPFPLLSPILKTTEVFLLILCFPSGLRVERQVRHGSRSGGAVKQSKWGRLLDVPVPRKITSMELFAVGMGVGDCIWVMTDDEQEG